MPYPNGMRAEEDAVFESLVVPKPKRIRTKSRVPLEDNVAELFRLALVHIAIGGKMRDLVHRILFCTFTMVKKCFDRKELSRRWNSYCTNVLRNYVQFGVAVVETHQDGSFHIHAIVLLPWEYTLHSEWQQDVARNSVLRRTGRRGYYARFDPKLRWFWNEMRERGLSYGFGQFEALPPKKDGVALSRYISKYLSKSLDSRQRAIAGGRTDLRGMRFVRYINAMWSRKTTPEVVEWKVQDDTFVHRQTAELALPIVKSGGERIRPTRNFRVPPGVGAKPRRRRYVWVYVRGKTRERKQLQYTVQTGYSGGWRVASCQYGSVLGGYKWRRVLTLVNMILQDNGWPGLNEKMLEIAFTADRKRRECMLEWLEHSSETPSSECVSNPRWGYRLSRYIYDEHSIFDRVTGIVSQLISVFSLKPPVLWRLLGLSVPGHYWLNETIFRDGDLECS